VENNEIEAELKEEQGQPSVCERLNWGLEQQTGSSRNAQRFTGHEA
jgi:hypothetical protein